MIPTKVSRDAPPRGISPVLLTPFTTDGTVDEAGFVRTIDHVLSLGVDSMMFPGFASEVLALSDAERDSLTQLLLEQTTTAVGRPTVIASVSDHATYHATRRAATLAEWGVGALNVLPPHQLGPSAEAVETHLKSVLEAAAPVPVIIQYAPAEAGTALDTPAITRLAAQHENLVAIKVESHPPGRMVAALHAADPPVPSLVGYGGVQMLDSLIRGAAGVQPGCSFTELYLAVWDRWEAGEAAAARELHERMLPYLTYWMQDVSLIVAAEKLIAQRRGMITTDVCRAPVRPLDHHEHEMVTRFCTVFAEYLPVVRS